MPRSEGGEETVTICRDCHDAVHALIPNRELAGRAASVEALRADPAVARAVAFLARRPSVTRTRTRRPRRGGRR
ncbi:MAG: hypothetical protein MUE51_02060 [Thermoleophilia bacterium]|nr:hypothetical protein [Thermoleophilia bacterium]